VSEGYEVEGGLFFNVVSHVLFGGNPLSRSHFSYAACFWPSGYETAWGMFFFFFLLCDMGLSGSPITGHLELIFPLYHMLLFSLGRFLPYCPASFLADSF